MLTILGVLGSLVTGAFGFAKSIASETTIRTVAGLKYGTQLAGTGINASASVMKTAMNHNVFWYAWGGFALPAAAWFALGMFYSTFPMIGGDWYVAALKDAPELKATYDIIVANIFWTGATGFGIQTTSNVVDRILKHLARK